MMKNIFAINEMMHELIIQLYIEHNSMLAQIAPLQTIATVVMATFWFKNNLSSEFFQTQK